jgi:hypothetical protein
MVPEGIKEILAGIRDPLHRNITYQPASQKAAGKWI